MTKLTDLFDKPNLSDWVSLLKKELKDEPFDKLLRRDDIEGISFETFQHTESISITPEEPGFFPYTRGYNTKAEAWKNGHYILVTNEKEANTKALDILMKGADLLVFDYRCKEYLSLEVLLENIEINYITSDFLLSSFQQLDQLVEFYENSIPPSIRISIGAETIVSNAITDNIQLLKSCNVPIFSINAFELQQCGCSVSEEIAYALSAGHSLLFELLHSGIPLEKATKLLQFKFGTGSTYFYEIAKYRVFRKLWSTIIAAYQPSNQESYHTVLSAVSGSMNKSLKDPYTNLLRQTTEAMSAVIGGVDSILILPYDHQSLNGPTTLAERMALNISLILKEESFMDKVNDATGGAYAIEQLTQLFSDKSWELFRILENKGGLFQTPTMDYLRVQVTSTAKKRKEAIQSGSKVVIGINKFPNPEQLSPEFKEENMFHGLSKLSYEQITLTTLSSK